MAQQTEAYQVKDLITQTILGNYSSLTEAQQVYQAELENYEELAILQQERILQTEYGIIAIGSGACDTNFEFTNVLTQQNGYVNGCYGADALYLQSDLEKGRVQFMISGAIGWADLDQVTILPLSSLSQLSSYIVLDGQLVHQIKGDLSSTKYASLITLTAAPKELQSDQIYLSYDGHYFYEETQFQQMVDDVRLGHREHAVNALNPYYNYYQYVSHRTRTNADSASIQAYIEETLMATSPITAYSDQDKDSANDTLTQSQLVGYEAAFFEYQNLFGANALMMLSLSMNESASGRSSLSFTRNNLFGHAAYDSDVEKHAARYLSVANSIYSHAKNYISGSYLNPDKFQYHGGYFGNKASGMNVSYASDPYWGEKAAQYYARLDAALGYPDLNSQCLAIKTEPVSIPIYDETGIVLFESGIHPDQSFVVLEELETTYKIQLDPALYPIEGNEIDFTYDFERNVGYIDKSAISVLINPEKIHEEEWVTIRFDAQEGTFSEGSSVRVFQVGVGEIPQCGAPVKENAVFLGWDQEPSSALKEITYYAQYREIQSIRMLSLPSTVLEYNDRINLEGGQVEVLYADQQTEIIPLTTSMISGIDPQQPGTQTATVRYGGAVTTYTMEVVMELDTIRREITEEIQTIISDLRDKEELDETDQQRLMTLKKQMEEAMFPYMTFAVMRDLDKIFARAEEERTVIIQENAVHLGVSGLYYATSLQKEDFFSTLFHETLRIQFIEEAVDADKEALLKKVAEGNGFQPVSSFSLYGKSNFDELVLNDYILVTLDLPESVQPNQIVTVLQWIDGEVVKLATQQSVDQLTFKTSVLGDYLITVRNSTNRYEGFNPNETCTFETNGFDLFAFMSVVPWAILGILAFLLVLVLSWKQRLKKKRHRIARKKESLKKDRRI